MEELFKELSVGYLTGNITEAETYQFIKMYKSSPEYVKIFNEIESAYKTGLISKFEVDKSDNYRVVKERIRLSSIRRKIFGAAAIAASVLLACILSVHILNNVYDTDRITENIVSYVATDKMQVVLPDGSLIWLKPGSELSYDKEGFDTERVVTLEGEACFDIRHNQHNPFVVKTNLISVKVLGTIFNLKTTEDVAETTLIRGLVLLQNTEGKEIMYLKPDHQVSYKEGRELQVKELDAWDFLLEQYGSVTIPDADLSEIIGVIEREYGVSVSLVSKPEECTAVTFGFSKGDKCEDVLKRLQMVSGCKMYIND